MSRCGGRGGHRGGGAARGSRRGRLRARPEGVQFGAVAALQLGELGGERADDVAWVVGVNGFWWSGRCGALLGAKLFHPVADLGER